MMEKGEGFRPPLLLSAALGGLAVGALGTLSADRAGEVSQRILVTTLGDCLKQPHAFLLTLIHTYLPAEGFPRTIPIYHRPSVAPARCKGANPLPPVYVVEELNCLFFGVKPSLEGLDFPLTNRPTEVDFHVYLSRRSISPT